MTHISMALVDILYWPVVQLSVSAVFIRVPSRFFSWESERNRLQEVRRSLRLYRRLRVPYWKKKLPDAAFLVGGTRKRVNPYCHADVSRFLTDLRRAEVAHWTQLAFAVPCWFWNPIWASVVMTAYAICTNVPCIAAQRYNRILVGSRRG